MSGTKALHGHALGATGAIEAAICALCLDRGWLPAAGNITTPTRSATCPSSARAGWSGAWSMSLSNSFGFGGLNVGLVFRRYHAGIAPR